MSDHRLATRHQDADDSAGLLLWQVTNRWQSRIRAALKPFGLTHVQFVLLAALTWADGGTPLSQKGLAERAATDPMMTSQVLRALEDRGLVRREPDPNDRRARAIAVTPTGVALVNQAVVAVEDTDAAFFAALGTDRAQFTAALLALRNGQAG
jgi:DNA-binding MarR family transcriptional regulator